MGVCRAWCDWGSSRQFGGQLKSLETELHPGNELIGLWGAEILGTRKDRLESGIFHT